MTTPPGISRRLWLWNIGGFFLGVGFIVLLFRYQQIGLQELLAALKSLSPLYYALVVLMSFLYVWIGAVKWRRIARSFHDMRAAEPRPHFYFFHTALQTMLGQIVPQAIATTLGRPLAMRHGQQVSLQGGFGNALYDQGFDFFVLLLLVPLSLLQLAFGFGFIAWLFLALFVLTFASYLLAQCAQPLLHLLNWAAQRANFMARFSIKALEPDLMADMLRLSALRIAVLAARLVLGAMAIDVLIPAAPIIYATPLASLVALAPISPANLGVAEWAWTYLLHFWQVPIAMAAIYAVSFRLQVFVAQALVLIYAGLIYAARRPRD